MSKKPVITCTRDWQDLIGIQFALGGSDPAIGLNCYGLVREVYMGLQIELPERQETALGAATAVEAAGNDWTLLEEPQPFAVTLIRSHGHASRFHLAIVTPDLALLHALPKKGVVVSRIEDYTPQIIGFYCYTPGEGEPLPVADGNVGRIIGAIVVTIVSVVASVYSYGLAGGAAAGWTAAAWGAVAGTAVSMAGNLILNAVAPLKPDVPQISGWGGDLADSRSYTWDGIINETRQGLSKAVIFGRVKVGGQIISEKTWFDGANNEYLDMLLCPCVGRVTRFQRLQLNDTDISLYRNTAPVYRPGDDEQLPIDMFDRVYLQYSSAAKIPFDASTTAPEQSVQFATKGACSGVRLTITAPNGIYELPAGTPIPHDVEFSVQYRAIGDVEWLALPTVDPHFATNHPWIHRNYGSFSGGENPFTLTDTGAAFADRISPEADFQINVGGVTYYCSQLGTLTSDAVTFNAYTDEGKTTPVGSVPGNGAYYVNDNTAKPYTGTMPVAYYPDYDAGYDISKTPVTAFEAEVDIKAVSFKLVVSSNAIRWARLVIKYAPVVLSGKLSWVTVDVFDAGYPTRYESTGDDGTTLVMVQSPPIGEASRDISIQGLAAGKYVIAVGVENSEGGTVGVNNVRIENLSFDTSSVDGQFRISADLRNPMHIVTKQIEIQNLPENDYEFRIWRTTTDHTEITWQDDVYLRGYAEIINRELAYPAHSLIGVRAMATDRLYGGRPRVTSIATGAPLTVPAAHLRFDTTTAGDSVVTEYTIVNGVVVAGMRRITVNAALPAHDGTYFWMVRMDSAGFAQPDRLLTKHYLRVHSWEAAGEQTYIYVQDSEAIPNGTTVMLFNENACPYVSRHTAWAVAWMLIEGSHGRITENSIDWEAFAEWDAWNMELKDGAPRHLFDAVVDFSTDLWSLAMRTAQTARGNLMKKGSKYSVWIDKAATHRQVFGEGNSNHVTVTPIPRSDRANILTTSFVNEGASYEMQDISLEDVQGSEYPIVKNLPVQVGVTRESQVMDLMGYMLRQNRYVGAMISLEAGIDSIEVSVGDVFLVASQAKDFSISGRLVSVTKGVSVQLDQPFAPEEGVTYQLTVWGTDGALYTWTGPLTGADLTTLPAPAGLTDSGYYEHPYVLCKVTEERMKYRCLGARRAADTMHATLTGIEYRDEIYLND